MSTGVPKSLVFSPGQTLLGVEADSLMQAVWVRSSTTVTLGGNISGDL